MSVLSLTFIVLYLLVLLIYWKLPDKARNGFLLVISWLYMASWKIYDLVFLLAVILISWGTGKLLARYKQKSILWSTCGIVLLLAILFAVKYCQIPLEVLGISFFTFQAISYVIDVYRGGGRRGEELCGICFICVLLSSIVIRPDCQGEGTDC